MKNKDLFNKIISNVAKEVKKVLNEGELAIDETDDAIFERVRYLFDLDELLTDNILNFFNKCPLKLIACGSGFGGPFFVNNGHIQLNESAPSKTYSVAEVTKLAASKLGLNPGNVISVIFANNVETCVLILNKFDNKDFVINGMQSFGWSFSHSDDTIYKSYDISVLHFDPIFQNIVNAEIKKCSLLHHWTPKYNFDNIMKKGLIPKSNNYKFSYPPKIHLIKGSANNEEIYNIGLQLCNENKDIRNNREYILLNIDTTNILDKVEFFYDPRYEFGYYTKQHIDISCISKNAEHNFLKN